MALLPQDVPTMKEVASRAGVALSSVSRVLNNHPDVSVAMRDRVLRAVHELGYEPDLLAAGLRRGQTQTVGFIVADIVNPLFATMLRGAERELRKAGYSVLLAHSEGEPDRDAETARLFRRRRVDGLLLSLADEGREDTLAELQGFSVPIVLLDREVEVGTGWSAVLSDHRTGLRRATEHLIDLGHEDIRLIAGHAGSRPSRERANGFLEGFERRNRTPSADAVLHGSYSTEFGRRAVETMVAEGRLPTALIVGGNLIFDGVIASLRRHGVRIGRDISLITCDDIPLAEFHDPPISVVSRDVDAMGQSAAKLLLELLAESSARSETLPTAFIVRESTFVRH